MKIPDNLFEALYTGKGLEYIVDLCAELLGNPICVSAPGFIIIAEDTLFGFPFRKYAENKSLFISKESFMEIEKTERFNTILKSTEPIFYGPDTPIRDEYPNSAPIHAQGFIDCPIRIKGVFVGWICVVGTERAVKFEDVEIVDAMAKIVSCELQKVDFFSQTKGGMFDYFMFTLMERQTSDDYLLTRYLETLGESLTEEICVAVVQSQDPNKQLTNSVQNSLRTFSPRAVSGMYKKNIILLLCCDENGFPQIYTKTLQTFLKTNGLKMGISNPYRSLSGSYVFYLQAMKSLELGNQFNANDSIFMYLDYVALHGFDLQIEQIAPKDACHPMLWKWAISEEIGDLELLQTLYLYLYYLRNTKRVATAMQIHRNTLYYRLDKLRSILGKDLETGTGDFTFHYSFQQLKYYFGKYRNDLDFPYVSYMIDREKRLYETSQKNE